MKTRTANYVKNITGVLLIVLSITLLPALTLAPIAPDWTPLPLKNWAYDMRLKIGRPILTLTSLANAAKGEPTLDYITEYKKVKFESDDLILSGSLYGTSDPGKNKSGVLLVHGSTPQGSNLGIYRLLGKKLAALGYIVLSVDLRGYGQSEDPKNINDATSFTFARDVYNSITYLTSVSQIDKENIYVIGHSFGADTVISAVKNDNRVNKMILIGPGRRFLERGGNTKLPEFEYFKRRDMQYMKLSEPIPDEVFIQYRMHLPLENHMEYFSSSGHIPTMLIDGELESREDKEFLKKVYNSMAGQKAYLTIPNADHYSNIANFGNLIIYDETAVNKLIQETHSFMQLPFN